MNTKTRPCIFVVATLSCKKSIPSFGEDALGAWNVRKQKPRSHVNNSSYNKRCTKSIMTSYKPDSFGKTLSEQKYKP